MTTIREIPPAETVSAYMTMRELRPHLASAEEFSARVAAQRMEGYRLLGAFIDEQTEPVTVAGFRTLHTLAWGHTLYVDDLIAQATHRSAGYGGLLLDWLLAEAQRLGCDQFHLDSGVQRFGAHRFYFDHNLHISSHHFSRELDRDHG